MIAQDCFICTSILYYFCIDFWHYLFETFSCDHNSINISTKGYFELFVRLFEKKGHFLRKTSHFKHIKSHTVMKLASTKTDITFALETKTWNKLNVMQFHQTLFFIQWRLRKQYSAMHKFWLFNEDFYLSSSAAVLCLKEPEKTTAKNKNKKTKNKTKQNKTKKK